VDVDRGEITLEVAADVRSNSAAARRPNRGASRPG
jgi:hypothetical protein